MQRREQLLTNSNNEWHEERVEVNQRHLIDKILARYSSEHTIFRELIQNSNDAHATTVEISMSSLDSAINGIIFKNNGKIFSEDDWRRLKRIAEGNPDESKVGFFGVGFYSIFSVCEEPLIESGKQYMEFKWKGDQLFTRVATVEESSDWTVFYMNLRDCIDQFDWDGFAQFLCKSIMFTEYLSCIKVFLNEKIMLKVDKMIESRIMMKTPSTLSQVFQIQSVESFSYKIVIEKMFDTSTKSLFQSILKFANIKSNEDNKKPGTFVLDLNGVCAVAKSSLSSKFSSQMERIIKKKPSSTIKLSLAFLKESDANLLENPILSSVIPTPLNGRIYIGFPTHQSTGLAAHFCLPLIPTVERESIDFVDPILKQWNEEILIATSQLLRCVYDSQMMDSSADQRTLMKSFCFKSTTPNERVASFLRYYFLEASLQPLLLLDHRGSKCSLEEMRIIPDGLEAWLSNIPTVPKETEDSIYSFLKAMNRIALLDLSDILKYLRDNKLNEEEFKSCLLWLFKESRDKEFMSHFRKTLHVPSTNNKTLSEYNYFVNSNSIPADLIVPDGTFPACLSRSFSFAQLKFLGLQELTLFEWLQFAMQQKQFESSVEYIEKVLLIFSKANSLSQHQNAIISSLLMTKKCILCGTELRYPQEAHLPNSQIFRDLPVITFASARKFPDSFWLSIGVKAAPSLQVIFSRIELLEWDQVQLIKYLHSIKDHLTESEELKLKSSALFISTRGKRMPFSQMHFMNALIDENVLELDVLEGFRNLKVQSDLGKFLLHLGIKSHVDLLVLLNAISEKKLKCLDYFTDNYRHYELEYKSKYLDYPFVYDSNGNCTSPSQCYTVCDLPTFPILAKEFQPFASVLCVATYPKGHLIVEYLKKTKIPFNESCKVFSIFSHSFFSQKDIQQLQSIAFIPLADEKSYRSPKEVFFNQPFDALFDCLNQADYSYEAMNFLKMAGVQNEPDCIAMTEAMLSSVSDMKDEKHILAMTRHIALHSSVIEKKRKDLWERLKKENVLIGYSKEGKEFSLVNSSNIFIMDDIVAQRLFNPICSPSDPLFEKFYASLGAKTLSSSVSSRYFYDGKPIQTDASVNLSQLLHDRLPLLERPNWNCDIEVLEVLSVSNEKCFMSQKRILPSTCCLEGNCILITPNYDFFDVSLCVVWLMSKENSINDALLLSTLLSSSLESLVSKGFYVKKKEKIQAKAKEKDVLQDKKNIIDQYNAEGEKDIIEQFNTQDRKNIIGAGDKKNIINTEDNLDDLVIQKDKTVENGKKKNIISKLFNRKKSTGESSFPTEKRDEHSLSSMKSMLKQSIASCQGNAKNSLPRSVILPPPSSLSPPSQYCHEIPALHFLTSIKGFEFYSHESSKLMQSIIQSSPDQINEFIDILQALSVIFDLKPSSMHVFCDDGNETIAFNKNSSIFFNLHFDMERRNRDGQSVEERLLFWFMVCCHELAHNFIAAHNDQHEFFLSFFAETFLPSLMTFLKRKN